VPKLQPNWTSLLDRESALPDFEDRFDLIHDRAHRRYSGFRAWTAKNPRQKAAEFAMRSSNQLSPPQARWRSDHITPAPIKSTGPVRRN
jgi:hypothetical protein